MATTATEHETCPSFCEYETHENISEPDAPMILHGTEDHLLPEGFRVRIVSATDDEGNEHPEEPVAVMLEERILSLREARNIAGALLGAIQKASLSYPEVRDAYEGGAIGLAADLGLDAEHRNHAQHAILRADRARRLAELKAAQA